MRLFLLSILTLLIFDFFGQSFSSQYLLLTHKADSLFQLKDYKNSALTFSVAFKTFGNKGGIQHRYEAARAWAMINVVDSAFDCLLRISKAQSSSKRNYFMDCDKLIGEKDFVNLRSDKRWSILLDSIAQNKASAASSFNSIIMTVKNELNEPVSVFWLDNNNKEKFYFDLNSLEDRIQWTYSGHKWIIRRKKDLSKVTDFTVTKDNQTFYTSGRVVEEK